jgi:hypothetical protein
MSVFPCDMCGQRKPGKLASAYWAWFMANEERTAWKVRYCPECAVANLLSLLNSSRNSTAEEDVFQCISCGANAAEDSDPIYLTLFLPGKEQTEHALQLDAACAAKLRIPISEHGHRLTDRGGTVRGPSHTPNSAWDALGLEPT